jgi:hypothetical protein
MDADIPHGDDYHTEWTEGSNEPMSAKMYGVPDPNNASGSSPNCDPVARDDSDVDSDRVRAAYVKARRAALERKLDRPSNYGRNRLPKWDGGTDSAGRRHKPVWPKIAVFLKERECYCWDTYMTSQFVDGQLRTPTQTYNEAAWKRYQDYIRASDAAVAQKLLGDTRRFKLAIIDMKKRHDSEEKQTLWYMALTSPLVELSPLFAYCLAVSLNWTSIAQSNLSGALSQYLRHPQLYRRHWVSVIPQSFYQLAEQAMANKER